MPSLSPPPTSRITTQPTLAPSLTTKTSQPSLRTKPSGTGFVEADADARLRDRDDSPTVQPAFGGKRRVGKVDLGLRRREWVIVSVVCLIGAFVRLHHLSWPTSVV